MNFDQCDIGDQREPSGKLLALYLLMDVLRFHLDFQGGATRLKNSHIFLYSLTSLVRLNKSIQCQIKKRIGFRAEICKDIFFSLLQPMNSFSFNKNFKVNTRIFCILFIVFFLCNKNIRIKVYLEFPPAQLWKKNRS